MNWAGLVLYTKGTGHPILVVLSDPFPAQDPEIVIAVARVCDEWDEDDIIIPPEELPGQARRTLRIEQPLVALVDPVRVEDRINPQLHNRLAIAGKLDFRPLSRLQTAISNSPHVKGTVKLHLEAWINHGLPF